MRNLKIGQKMFVVATLFGTTLFAVFLAGKVSVEKVANSAQVSAKIANARNEQAYADMMHDALRAVVLRSFFDSSQGGVAEKEVKAELSEVATEFKEHLQNIQQMDVPQSVKTAVSELGPDLESYIESGQSMVDQAYTNLAKARASYPEFQKAFEVLEDDMASLNDQISAVIKENVKSSEATIATAKTLQVLIMMAGLILSSVMMFFLARNIKSDLELLAGRLKCLSDVCIASLSETVLAVKSGDLTKRCIKGTNHIPNPSRDEIGQAIETFNEMLTKAQGTIDGLNETLASLEDMVKNIRSASNEVATTGSHLGTAATINADTISDIAKAVDEVSQAGQQSAETATTVAQGSEQLAYAAQVANAALNELATVVESIQTAGKAQTEANSQARAVIIEGGQALNATINSMDLIAEQVGGTAAIIHELGTKQARIGEIVQTIDGIAEQTNLLALNAAIEAARAGEHGRGFAVVADEVRKLAEQSSASTRQIESLIDEIRKGVEESVKAMDASSLSVKEGTESSANARKALDDIMSTMEQAESIGKENQELVSSLTDYAEKVHGAFETVTNTTQDAAAAAQELSATSEEVSASATSVAHSIQQQSESIAELSLMAETLNRSSETLNNLVCQFSVSDSNIIELSAA